MRCSLMSRTSAGVEQPGEPFVLEVVAHVRDVRRLVREQHRLEAVVSGRRDARRRIPPWRCGFRISTVWPRSRKPAGDFVRAPSASAASRRKRIGRQDACAKGPTHLAPCSAASSARQCASQLSRRDTSRARRASEPLPARAVGQLHERAGERVGVAIVVEQPFALVFDDGAEPIDGGCDDRQARRHVLEHLQRRPVEAEAERRMARRRRTAPRRCRRRPGRRASAREAPRR